MSTSSNVYVGSDVLTDLQSNLNNLAGSLDELYETLVSQMNSLKSFWQDSKLEEFIAGYSGHIANCQVIANNYRSWATGALQNALDRVIEVERTDVSGGAISGGIGAGATTTGGVGTGLSGNSVVGAGSSQGTGISAQAAGVSGIAAMGATGGMSKIFNMGSKQANSFPRSNISNAQAKWEEEHQMSLDTENYRIDENGNAVPRSKTVANEETSLGSTSVENDATVSGSGSPAPSAEAKIIANAVKEGRAKEAQNSPSNSTPDLESWQKEILNPSKPNPSNPEGAMISKILNDKKATESIPPTANIGEQAVKGTAVEGDPATIIANAVSEGRAKDSIPTETNIGGQDFSQTTFPEPTDTGAMTMETMSNTSPSQPISYVENPTINNTAINNTTTINDTTINNTTINNTEINNVTINNITEKNTIINNTTINNQNVYYCENTPPQHSGLEGNNISGTMTQPPAANPNDTGAVSVGNDMKDNISNAGAEGLSHVPFPETTRKDVNTGGFNMGGQKAPSHTGGAENNGGVSLMTPAPRPRKAPVQNPQQPIPFQSESPRKRPTAPPLPKSTRKSPRKSPINQQKNTQRKDRFNR